MRKWLVRKILGNRKYELTLGAIETSIGTWTECVEDLSKHGRSRDDRHMATAILKDIKIMDEFWF